MWLVTTRGFFSVVADRDDAGAVLVRARAREDLESLAELVPGLEVEHTPRADYAYRARVPREVWASVVATLGTEIDYGNFKDAVARRQGLERASIYAVVWATLRELQSRVGSEGDLDG
jgi:hypothetical protein